MQNEMNILYSKSVEIFPANNFKVMGLLTADIIQNHKFTIDYVNQDFQIL